MATTAADIIAETLTEWGVDTIFGLPGDGINGLIESLRTRQDKIRFIQHRHEEAAAFAACGYAKATGRLGVCLATSGPGGIHLLNGLYDAKMDGAPVLAITGLHHHDLLDTHSQQDVDLDKLFQDVTIYNARIMSPEHAENATNLACRNALARRGVAHITIPSDLQTRSFDKKNSTQRNVPGHLSYVKPHAFCLPEGPELGQAAEILNAGKKIVIMAGQGAIGCRAELEDLAEKLGAPIVKPLLGKAAVPDRSPYCLGGCGLLGTTPSQEALESCDTLLIVGSSFPYLEYYPDPDQARAVQIDIDPTRIGLRFPVEVGLVGDAKKTLQALIPAVGRNEHRDFLKKRRAEMAEWRALMEERGTRPDTPMKPQVVAWEIGKRLASDAVYVADSGTITTWYARQIEHREGQYCTLSGTLATMACGLPYSIGIQAAYPERQVVCLIGDGGFSMLMGELATLVTYNLPAKIFIFKNNTLGQIKWEQMVFEGNPEYAVDLHPIDFAKFAEACGAKGITVTDPKDMGSAVDEAFAHKGPVVVDCEIDPHEPPMPPKVKFGQAKEFAKALVKGEPYRGKIALTIASDKVRETI
jgi:pyruvate dehydrogenase (quinone)/pyruvate oxidase